MSGLCGTSRFVWIIDKRPTVYRKRFPPYFSKKYSKLYIFFLCTNATYYILPEPLCLDVWTGVILTIRGTYYNSFCYLYRPRWCVTSAVIAKIFFFNVLYQTCEVYDISTSLQVEYSFSLIIGVLGLYVWKPGLKSFIDNSSASVECEGFFFTDDNEEGEGEKPSFDKKKSFVANKIVFYNGRTFCMTCLVWFMKRKYKLF